MKYDEDFDDYSEELEEGICAECGEECFAKTIDNGIGGYEFWGAKGTHHDYQVVSNCCEAEFIA